MKLKRLTHCLPICLLCCFWAFSFVLTSVHAQNLNRQRDGIGPGTDNHRASLGQSSILQDDSADVAIDYTTCYPGHSVDVGVWLKSPVPIAGFQFMITISNPDLINFHTDSIGVVTIMIPVDTCTGPPPHGPSCFVDSAALVPVRYCHIDTVGSLAGNFWFVECHGDTADTSQPDCKWIEVLGIAQAGDPIPPDSNYQLLFKFLVDVLCLSDSTSDRSVTFYMTPGGNSFLSDPNYQLVPFRYHPGGVTAWWSVPGDASNDSLVDLADLVFLINYLYRDGPEPCIMEAADPNGDCLVDLADLVYLIIYLFREGDPPVPGCAH